MKISFKFILSTFTILVLAGVIYGHTLDASWHFDDYEFIVLNERVHDLSDMHAIRWAAATPTRFIAFLSFAVNYHFHQLDVTGYHVVNIAIHVVNTFLVWLLIYLLSLTPTVQSLKATRYRYILSFIVALLFLVHPIQTQAITYITQRFASLATLFYVLSLVFYIAARLSKEKRIIYFVGSFIAALLGMFTKQILLTLPFMIILVEICFFQKELKWQQWKRGWRWYYLIPLVVLFVIIPSLYGWRINFFLTVQGISRSHVGDIITFWSYFLTQFRVIPTYIRLLFLPIGQTLDYDFMVSTSIFAPKVLLGAAFLGSIILFGIKMYPRNRYVAFGVFWFFLALSVESSFIPILQVIFEHRCYLPSIGFFLVVCALLLEYISLKRFVVIVSIVVVTLTFMAHQRNKVWATEISLWKDIHEKAPHKVRPYIHLGVAYLMEGRYEEALSKLTTAATMEPNNYKVFHNRGIVYSETNQLDKALSDFNRAIDLYDRMPETFNGRGSVYEKMGKNKEAFINYNQALKINPKHGAALSNRANIFIKANQYPLALKDLMAAEYFGYPVDQVRLEKLKMIVLNQNNDL